MRHSEEKLRILFKILPIGVSITGKEPNMIDANPALEKILGMSRESLVAREFADRQYLRHDGTEFPKRSSPVSVLRQGRRRSRMWKWE